MIGRRYVTLRHGWFSRGIAWWIHSRASHVVPLLDDGTAIDITWPGPKLVPADSYLQGQHDVWLLTPIEPMPDPDAWIAAGLDLLGLKYDARSYLGFLANHNTEDGDRVNCAEGMLRMDHAGGILSGRDMRLISPQSYLEFAAAGLFRVERIA